LLDRVLALFSAAISSSIKFSVNSSNDSERDSSGEDEEDVDEVVVVVAIEERLESLLVLLGITFEHISITPSKIRGIPITNDGNANAKLLPVPKQASPAMYSTSNIIHRLDGEKEMNERLSVRDEK
jgi:hypothetical protein